MNLYEDELRNKWNSIDYHDGGSKQLAIEHPLEWHVRYAAKDYKSLVIVSEFSVDSIASSKSIEASCNQRKDGRYAITFTLLDKEQEEVFFAMSSDIIEFSKERLNPQDSLKSVLRRYAAWMKLFEHKRSAFLSINSQKGLLAELLFLKEQIEQGLKPSEATAGWVGPDGADQDFVYENGWYEIKATGMSSAQITISSAEQLGNPLPGELVVFRVDKCAPAYPGAVTLYKLVHTLLNMMRSDIAAIDEIILKLGSAGYIDMNEYDKQHFSVSSKQSYLVDESFPKITRNALSPEIANVQYQLDLPSLTHWIK